MLEHLRRVYGIRLRVQRVHVGSRGRGTPQRARNSTGLPEICSGGIRCKPEEERALIQKSDGVREILMPGT